MKRVMVASMVLAQVVGLVKLELVIQMTGWITDPMWLRGAVYTMGGALALVTAWLNVRIVRRLDVRSQPEEEGECGEGGVLQEAPYVSVPRLYSRRDNRSITDTRETDL